jgi:uncharacterized protein YaeQ
MALKSTIYKVNLSIADIDNSYYADHALTLARHPSETDERMMIRLLALALNAYKLQADLNGDGVLAFGSGLSDPDDPDLSLRDFTGQTRLWVEVGQPEDKPLNKACQKAEAVMVYCFNHAAEVWWRGIESKLSRMEKLHRGQSGIGQVGRAQYAIASHRPRGCAHLEQFKRQCAP